MPIQKLRKTCSIAALLVGAIGGPMLAEEGPTDAQIVGIVIAANDIDIAYGKMALEKSKNKSVREYAQRMTAEHTAVQASVTALAAKLGVQAEESPTSDSLKKGAAAVMTELKALKGKAFDKFYVDTEAGYHKAVTDAVATVLIPSARNLELKTALQSAQPLFLKHLEHVRMIQAAQK